MYLIGNIDYAAKRSLLPITLLACDVLNDGAHQANCSNSNDQWAGGEWWKTLDRNAAHSTSHRNASAHRQEVHSKAGEGRHRQQASLQAG